jgi:hypothetical protein
VITFDTGALIALERKGARMLRVVDAAAQSATRITVPTVVVAEWWRDGSNKESCDKGELVGCTALGLSLLRGRGSRWTG